MPLFHRPRAELVALAALLLSIAAPARAEPAGPFEACLAAGDPGDRPSREIACRAPERGLAQTLAPEAVRIGATRLMNASLEHLITGFLARRVGGACDGALGRSGFLPYPGHDFESHPAHARLEPRQSSTLVWDLAGCDRYAALTEVPGRDYRVEILELRGVKAVDLSGLEEIRRRRPPWLRHLPFD